MGWQQTVESITSFLPKTLQCLCFEVVTVVVGDVFGLFRFWADLGIRTRGSHFVQDGANIRKVDVNDDKVLIRLSTDGGLQF